MGGNDEVWVYACWRCNADQGSESFYDWARHLERHQDPRAAFVRELDKIISAWCEANDVQRHDNPKRDNALRIVADERF